ncbi:hypothetical protein ABZS88_46590 [Streptomyces sp. NPDC005480]
MVLVVCVQPDRPQQLDPVLVLGCDDVCGGDVAGIDVVLAWN